jgi:DNA-binding protein HU-beta
MVRGPTNHLGRCLNVNKAELIDAIADRTGIAKSTVDSVIKGMTETIEMQVASGDKIQIPGFISFQKVKRAARTGRNPQTGETIQIPASSTVKVTAGARLKASVSTK